MRLTLPAAEPGMRYILADGVKVGHVVDVWSPQDPWRGAWEATLHSVPGRPSPGDVKVCCLRLADLRAELEDRLATKGPWWAA